MLVKAVPFHPVFNFVKADSKGIGTKVNNGNAVRVFHGGLTLSLYPSPLEGEGEEIGGNNN